MFFNIIAKPKAAKNQSGALCAKPGLAAANIEPVSTMNIRAMPVYPPSISQTPFIGRNLKYESASLTRRPTPLIISGPVGNSESGGVSCANKHCRGQDGGVP